MRKIGCSIEFPSKRCDSLGIASLVWLSDDCTKRMEVSGLAQGAYFVRVSGEGVNQVKKLVVK
ncbi:MAG: T9SS type A sorting domain-containing protein [Bacteroidales bacterium]|nr:T9SS type A sorting domain-containing protein [Bacteroidales bacterium]